MYNSLPLGIKQCDGLKIFKRELKKYSTIFLVVLIGSIISLLLLRFTVFRELKEYILNTV